MQNATPERGVSIPLGLSAQRALGRVNRALFVSLGAGFAPTVLGLIGMVSLTRWTLRPLGRMAQVARAVAEGDISQRVAMDSLDEIGTLARAFGEMTESLSLSRAELDRRNQALLEAVTKKERLYRETECSLTELRNAQSRLAYSEEARRTAESLDRADPGEPMREEAARRLALAGAPPAH